MSLSFRNSSARIAKATLAAALFVAPTFVASAAFADPSAPSAPLSVQVTPLDGALLVTWSAPTDDGGDTITGYTVYADDGVSPSTCAWTSGSLQCTVSSLTNGTTYAVTVTATNSVGEGTAASAVNGTPNVVPGAPTLSSVVPQNGSIVASWTAPSNNGTEITGYTVSVTDGTTTTTCTTTSLTCTVTGLTNGVEYTVTMVATNSFGNSDDSSSLSATPRTTPTSPTLDTLTPSNGTLLVTWSAPSSNGGADITTYTATASDGTTSKTCGWTTGDLECTITGLSNGTEYSVTVTATNAAGTSDPSGSGASVPRTTPDAPTIGTATPGDTQIVVTWSAPSSNGGATIDSYTATATDGTTSSTCEWTTGSLQCTITGLDNGTQYSVSVSAHNAAGDSASSTSVNATPRTVPGAPDIDTITAGNGQLQVSWTAPTDDGGAAISQYTVGVTDGTTTTTCGWTSGPLNCTVYGLTNGTEYSVTVTATNVAGTSSPSTYENASPLTVPGAPTVTSVTPTDAGLTVTWSAPASNGGSSIVAYTVTADDGTNTTNCDWTTGPLTCDVVGLDNGTSYSVTVVATNAAGDSVASSSSSATPHTTPDAPDAPDVTVANQSLVVNWTAPASDGGAEITEYLVTATAGSTVKTCTTSLLTCTVTGLTNGTEYSVTVSATNAAGSSSESSPTLSTPSTMPGAPTNVAPSRALDTITVTWSAPASNGGDAITGYTVTGVASDGSDDVTCSWSDGDGALTCDLAGVVNTANYQITVVATNGNGDSAASSSVTSTGYSVPGAPTITSITPGNTQLTVVLTPGTTGGLDITNYVYSLDNGVTYIAFDSTTGPFIIDGLTNGTTYRISVAAVNDIDTGTFSNRVTAVPATVATAPRWLHGVRGNMSATLAWNPPLSNGGAAVLSYTVTDLHGHTCTTSSLTCTVTGLTNGTAYQWYVTATNARGESPRSNANTVIPATNPGLPTIVSAVGANKSIVVTFTPPTQNGGAALGYYDYSLTGGTTWLSGQYRTVGNVMTITGLVNGTAYQLSLRARNTVGPSAGTSTRTITPFGTPFAPVITSATGISHGATISFTAPNTNGSAVTTYQYSLDGKTWTTRSSGTTSRTLTITGLAAAKYYSVMVRAVNAAGPGLASPPFRVKTH